MNVPMVGEYALEGEFHMNPSRPPVSSGFPSAEPISTSGQVVDDVSQAMDEGMNSVINSTPELSHLSEYNMGMDMYVEPAQYGSASFQSTNQEQGIDDESGSSRERVLFHLSSILKDRICLEVEEFRGRLLSILDEQNQNVQRLMQIFQSSQNEPFDSQTESTEVQVETSSGLVEPSVEPSSGLSSGPSSGLIDEQIHTEAGMPPSLPSAMGTYRSCSIEDLKSQYLLKLFMASSKMGAMLTRKEFRT